MLHHENPWALQNIWQTAEDTMKSYSLVLALYLSVTFDFLCVSNNFMLYWKWQNYAIWIGSKENLNTQTEQKTHSQKAVVVYLSR